jgi:hypothetical protein
MSFEIEEDADTGEEILWFMRRGRPYLFLRDPDTKAFIKMLIGVEQRLFMVVDYSEDRASKGNPLYVDATVVMALSPESFPDREENESRLESLCGMKVSELFGAYVTDELLDLSGVEIGSELRRELITTTVEKRIVRGKEVLVVREVANETIFYWSVVWKHHPQDSPKSEEGFDIA